MGSTPVRASKMWCHISALCTARKSTQLISSIKWDSPREQKVPGVDSRAENNNVFRLRSHWPQSQKFCSLMNPHQESTSMAATQFAPLFTKQLNVAPLLCWLHTIWPRHKESPPMLCSFNRAKSLPMHLLQRSHNRAKDYVSPPLTRWTHWRYRKPLEVW